MLYAIRHGETDLNKIAIMQGGGTNPPLNELGHKQAIERGKTLQNLGIEEIYSSDLIRTKETAYEINKFLGLCFEYDIGSGRDVEKSRRYLKAAEIIKEEAFK